MKRWMIVISACLLLTMSCGETQVAPRQPVSLASVQKAAVKFDRLAGGLLESWNSRDAKVVKEFFTEDAEAYDRSFGDHSVGPSQISGLISQVAPFGKNWEGRQVDQYIGLENGLAVDELINLKFGNVEFTPDHPMMEADWLQTRGDLIASWTILYGLDTLEELKVPTSKRLEQARSLLSTYQTAWSSGDKQAVTELYASEAVREDMMFMEQQSGQEAIATFAQSFFGWYPGVQWKLSLAFGEGLGSTPITGGLYVIKVKDINGQPCEVKVAVLLNTSENLITHETLYYEPQSLISCGWAK